uniref:Zinc finger MYND-type containing 8 n=1 Tax=Salmo trutta TaxID=8032 RepID=A0A674ACK4_SALTR
SFSASLAEEEVKTESDAVEGMEISTRSKDPGTVERAAQKRKVPSPPHSSNGHSPAETSPSPVKKKKKPGAVSSSKDQSELRHGPFYYVKQPALTTDPVDVVPQDGRNDFYCWLCHREGQVLCCELCPRVYHAKCLKLPAEPEGDWFCPECEKITVAECIETQSKAMTMLTIDQLSYLLKFSLQKMKQPGTEPFQKPVSLEQHPDYAEYIFHAMDLGTLEKNTKKKMYGCTEAFLADVKWILHNCNHKLTATAKVIVKICEHEMNEIEVCPECYLSACQKRDNWFCEPCSNPHPLVWAKLKGFPFWPAKALRDKDGQVDARFFGQHDRAWVPLNNCYLMSREIPFSVKKTKSIFNSAMQEMEVYVENMRKKFGVFNYAPFRTPYTPDNQYQMLLDPANPSSGSVRPEKQEKIKFNFDMTASPKMPLARSMLSDGGMGGVGGSTGRRISLTDMPRSPMSTNSSAHTGSDGEQDTPDKGPARAPVSHYSAGEESMDCTASPASTRPGPASGANNSPKPFHSQCPALVPKQEKATLTGSILNLNLDRSKAEMDLKELSETVQQQQQGAPPVLTSPKRQIRSRFQLNLDKTIESCKAQLGIDEISEDVYKGVEHSDSEDSDKSDSSDSDASDEEQKPKAGKHTKANDKGEKDPSKRGSKDPLPPSLNEVKTKGPATATVTIEDAGPPEEAKAAPVSPASREKPQVKQEARQPSVVDDSDSERELVIDLGEDQRGRDRKKSRKDSRATKNPPANKTEGETIPLNMVSFTTASSTTIDPTTLPNATLPMAPITSSSATTAVKKQRPLLPRETVPVVQRAVSWFLLFTLAVQQKDPPLSTSTSSVTLVTSTPPYVAMMAAPGLGSGPSTPSSMAGDFKISTASADVAADIAKYTNKIMDTIKGTVTELYTDLSKNTSGNTLAEIRRLRIEIEKLQWLHQQELSEMKHNLELTMAEMRQSLEQERERLMAEVKKQMEVEKQQAVDETKKKQWCANCKKEAIFYCCWNTSYCDYPCQQAHWPEHMKSCTQSATASQQEPESGSTADGPNKASGQSSGQTSPRGTTSAPTDKDSNVEKSKDNVTLLLWSNPKALFLLMTGISSFPKIYNHPYPSQVYLLYFQEINVQCTVGQVTTRGHHLFSQSLSATGSTLHSLCKLIEKQLYGQI